MHAYVTLTSSYLSLFPAVRRRTRVLMYNTLVLPHFDYCSCVWGTGGVNLQMKLERIQNNAMRLITSAKHRKPSARLQSELSWMYLQDRREMQVVMKVHSRKLNTEYRNLRGANNIQLQCPHTNFYRKSFEFNGAYLWNKLPRALKWIRTRETFRLFGSIRFCFNLIVTHPVLSYVCSMCRTSFLK